jgi:hypothetical protein
MWSFILKEEHILKVSETQKGGGGYFDLRKKNNRRMEKIYRLWSFIICLFNLIPFQRLYEEGPPSPFRQAKIFYISVTKI